MISNYLYLFSIGIAFVTIIFIIYNFILLVKKRKNDSVDENKKEDIIRGYKNNLGIFTIVLIICIGYIFYYSRPIKIYETIDTSSEVNYDTINIYGNITGDDSIKLSSEQGEKVFNLLEKYKYKRIFNFSDVTGEVEFILFENIEGKPGILEVWNTGYIRIPNHKLYKIEVDNKVELYNELKSIIKD